MTSHLDALCIDAVDPERLAVFWAGVLRRELTTDDEGNPLLLPGDDVAFPIYFSPTAEPRTGPNQMHAHLTSSSPREQQETGARVLDLGGRHLDVGQLPDEGHVVLA